MAVTGNVVTVYQVYQYWLGDVWDKEFFLLEQRRFEHRELLQEKDDFAEYVAVVRGELLKDSVVSEEIRYNELILKSEKDLQHLEEEYELNCLFFDEKLHRMRTMFDVLEVGSEPVCHW